MSVELAEGLITQNLRDLLMVNPQSAEACTPRPHGCKRTYRPATRGVNSMKDIINVATEIPTRSEASRNSARNFRSFHHQTV